MKRGFNTGLVVQADHPRRSGGLKGAVAGFDLLDEPMDPPGVHGHQHDGAADDAEAGQRAPQLQAVREGVVVEGQQEQGEAGEEPEQGAEKPDAVGGPAEAVEPLLLGVQGMQAPVLVPDVGAQSLVRDEAEQRAAGEDDGRDG